MVVELQRDPGDDPQQDFEDGSKKFIFCQPGETKGGEGGGCGDEERKGRKPLLKNCDFFIVNVFIKLIKLATVA